MKQVLGYILLVCCLVLSAHSLIYFLQEDISSGCCTECSIPLPDNTENNDMDCDNTLCNPFTQCTCCAGFLPALVYSSPETIQFLCILEIDYSENHELQFISDHWQPPKNG